MIITPCEIAVKDILPAIRALIVRELYERGLKQKEIASKLKLTQPAVSYYLNQRRAKKVKLIMEEKAIMDIIKEIVNKILDGEVGWSDLSTRFCEMCKLAQVRIYGYTLD